MFRVKTSNKRLLGAIDPLSTTLIARMETAPSPEHRIYINRLMVSLKEIGVLSKMDAFYVMSAHTEQAAKLNWIADVYNLAASDPAPTFEAFNGYTPNGTSSYLDTGFNPTQASSPKFTLNSGHQSAWHLTNNLNAGGNSFDFGNTNSQWGKLSNNSVFARINNATNVTGVTNMALCKTWNRSASNAYQYYASGAEVTSGTTATTAFTNYSFSIGRTAATSFGVNQAAVVHFGSQLSSGEIASIYSACRSYLISVGAI